MVFVCLDEYAHELRRLDSRGETNPTATFLATTLGLRRLSLSEAISIPKLLPFSILFPLAKYLLNSTPCSQIKNKLRRREKTLMLAANFSGDYLSAIANFYTLLGRKGG